jgi:DNA-binding NtrC family response regulator
MIFKVRGYGSAIRHYPSGRDGFRRSHCKFARNGLGTERAYLATLKTMRPAILYVDDERANLDLFRRTFDEEFRVLTAETGQSALAQLETEQVGVLATDQRMAPMTGIELLTQTAARWPDVTRMLLTAYADRDLLLQAITIGKVQDYLLKPWRMEELGLRLEAGLGAYEQRRAQARAAMERELFRAELEERHPSGIVGLDGGLSPLAAVLDRVARTDATVIVRGESGTGKELVARELHRRSLRADFPFVRVNCAAFSEGVLESELFGHEAGSFTGAKQTRLGRFEQADGGTLFLDEIGDVSPAVQVRLLRVLQERELERVGGNRTLKVDIRVIAATHRALEQMVLTKQFRQDLFYRLNVVRIDVPPLRARGSDVATLARHFVLHFSQQLGKRLTLTEAAVEALTRYDWPGNVRELRNAVERAVVLADDGLPLESEDFSFETLTGTSSSSPASGSHAGSVFEEIELAEVEAIKSALRAARGSKARAARILGIPRTTFNDRLKRLEIT